MSAFWPQERTEQLRQLHSEGLSFSVIATRLGVSRSSVAGMVARLDLPKRACPAVQRLQGKIAAKRYKHGKTFQLFFAKPPVKAFVKAAASPTATVDAPPPLNLSLIENNGCMWPTERGFCGHPKAGHKHRPHYCKAHCRA